MQRHGALCLSTLLLINAVVQGTAQEPDRHWERAVSLCGLSFKVPSDWVVSRDARPPGHAHCHGTLKSKLYDKLVTRDTPGHFWMISVEVLPNTLEEVMESYDVVRDRDRWFVGMGAREQPAYEIKGPGWRGLRV